MSYLHGYWGLTPFLTSIFSFFAHVSTYVARDIPDNVDVATVAAQVHCGDGFRGSNSVEIMNDSEPHMRWQGLLILMTIVLLES